jgi:crossover junction endonuclease MUS81
MKACPLRFEHPTEAQQLHGLGPKLCNRLTDKLKTHCSENGLPMPKLPHRGSKRQTNESAPAEENASPPPKKVRKVKAYVPTLRSGAYALILALATSDENASQGLTKANTIDLAQPHCDTSFTAPSDPTKFFTAWNSMKTLISKDLVYEHGRPLRRYMLTEEGWEVARRMKGIEEGSIRNMLTKDTSNAENAELLGKGSKSSTASNAKGEAQKQVSINLDDVSSEEETYPSGTLAGQATRTMQQTTSQPPPPDNFPNFEPIIFPPGSCSIHLVLDSREVRTVKDREYISDELQKMGVTPITRGLPLGDALWIARPKPAYEKVLSVANVDDDGEGCNEIALDHIIERKRLDDLISSIKDGRFHEQKFRLRRSGIPNVTYIIEDFSISAESGEKYGEAVSSAIASTQVVNGYFVKQTGKLDDTIRYLAKMTNMLQEVYEKKSLHVIPSRVLHPRTYQSLQSKLRLEQAEQGHYITFSAFSSLCSKSDAMSLRDVFLKMLMCTRGVTGEKALEIQKKWKTPNAFVEAFEKLDGKAKERMVSEQLGTMIPRKKVTPVLSAKIAEVWS